jgi:hypothetical protein
MNSRGNRTASRIHAEGAHRSGANPVRSARLPDECTLRAQKIASICMA